MDEKKWRQIELAKLFYEMGMEEDVILKISGIKKNEYINIQNKNKELVDKDKQWLYNTSCIKTKNYLLRTTRLREPMKW